MNSLEITGEHKASHGFLSGFQIYGIHLKKSEYIEQRIKSPRRSKYKKPFQSEILSHSSNYEVAKDV